MARPRETAKTTLIRLLLLVANVGLLGMSIVLVSLSRKLADFYDPTNPHAAAARQNESGVPTDIPANFSLQGAEDTEAPVSALAIFAWLVLATSMLGMFGACRTKKHNKQKRDVLLLYHCVVVVATAGCVWVSTMFLVFSARTEVYVERYWVYIMSAFPEGTDEADALDQINSHLQFAATLGLITALTLVVALYGSAHLVGHRYLTRNVLMWLNGASIMAGIITATAGLIVANEGLGGELFAYVVSGIGGILAVIATIGMHGARDESPHTLCLYAIIMVGLLLALGSCTVLLLISSDPTYFREHWTVVQEKVYPLSYDEAVEIASQNFAKLGALAAITTVMMLMSTVSALYLRHRIRKEGRFFEPLDGGSAMHGGRHDDDDEDEYGDDKMKNP